MKKPENFKCNELRDKKFAKFRCNGLITVAIYDLNIKKFIDKLKHSVFIYGIFLYATYEVGILTQPDKYEEDISVICASGIHYFLSLEAALNYENGIVKYFKNAKMYRYDGNGK
jgi:hypothetical protein